MLSRNTVLSYCSVHGYRKPKQFLLWIIDSQYYHQIDGSNYFQFLLAMAYARFARWVFSQSESEGFLGTLSYSLIVLHQVPSAHQWSRGHSEHQQTHISEETQAQIDRILLQTRREAENYRLLYEVCRTSHTRSYSTTRLMCVMFQLLYLFQHCSEAKKPRH